MLCDKCKTNQATVHIRQSINGNVIEYDLCEKCAAASNVFNNTSLSFDNLFEGFLNGIGHSASSDSIYTKGSVCPSCGMQLADFLNGGRLGCPDCYDAFRQELKGVLKNIQGSVKHTGKGSAQARMLKAKNAPKELTEEEKLKNELDLAIKNEEYEKAAELRDKIRVLKREEE